MFDFDAFLRSSLAEDIGRGDITSQLTVGDRQYAEGVFRAKSPLVLAGADIPHRVFALLDPHAQVEMQAADGTALESGTVFGTVRGKARALLAGERLALNLLQHLSGIATATRAYAEACRGTGARILDTRKTLPGLRLLEKQAVVAGGGVNHRFGLDDGILIKDNHIAIAGGLEQAIEAARRNRPLHLRVEVEVTSADEAVRAVEAGADMLLLDNMSNAELAEAVRRVEGRVPTEASGGVDLDTVAGIAATGVDFISVGRITHSAPAADINLKFRPLAFRSET